MIKRITFFIVGVLIAAAAVFIVPTLWFQPWSVNHFYARVFLTYALRHPMLLTQMGVLNGVPIGSWRDQLDDFSPAGEAADVKMARDNLNRLLRYDRTKMSPEARLSADVLEWFLRDTVEGDRFRELSYPLNQMYGFQEQLPDFMLNLQPLHSARDARSYVRRVAAFAPAVDQTLERVKIREARGVMPPRFVLREVQSEMERFVARPAEQNDLYTHFVAATDSMRGIEAKPRERLRADLRRILETSALPAYRRLIAVVAREESLSTDDDGVWKLPDGDKYYDYLLRSHTTSSLPADSIHTLGLREVERVQGEMRALMRRVPVRRGTFAEQLRQMRRDPAFGFPAGDKGRRQILARYDSILADASLRCDSLFGVRPHGRLRVERVPAFKEATSPGAYYNSGAFDGSRPGIFFANLRDPAETRRPDMRTLAYHEGIPGHHLQISWAQNIEGVPMARKVLPFTAYVEGWALYAERLAKEMGAYDNDPYGDLGRLQAEMFRAVRLVVDTGIHAKHWTRAQAIAYMREKTGMVESDVTSEVERYIVSPGQACAYKIGMLKILELRERAKTKLGARFDLKAFHDVILGGGAMPLTVLETRVNDWIAQTKAKG